MHCRRGIGPKLIVNKLPHFCFGAMASIRLFLSLAASEVDEEALYWSDVRVEALAVELMS